MSEPTESLSERIAARFNDLSPKQQKAARYLADHPAEAAFTSASELAKRLDVNAATIVRLSRELGYEGYPDLQRHARGSSPHHYPASTRREVTDHSDGAMPGVLSRTFAQDQENQRLAAASTDAHALEEIAESLLNARRILLFGGGVAAGVTAFLASSFRTIGLSVIHVTGDSVTLTQEVEILAKEDVAVGVAFYRYVREALDALERTRELGITSIALTDSPLSPAARLATHVLSAPVESTTHRISLVAPLAVANALLAACVVRGGERVSTMLERLDGQYRKAGLLVFE